jgi:hypothetical protein
MTQDITALLGQARLPERSVELCLRGDLAAELEELDRQFAALPESDGRLTSGAERRRLGEQAAALRGQMKASTVVFRLRGLSRRTWDALVKAHPPVEGVDEHKVFGYNTETFFDALVRASVVDPVLDDEQWTALIDVVTTNQWRKLALTAQTLSIGEVNVPFSRAASATTGASEPG